MAYSTDTEMITDEARRYSRTSSSGIPDSHVQSLINDALYAFSEDVFGFPANDYLTLTPVFDLETEMAVRITVAGTTPISATDISVIGTDAADQTGAQTASHLTTQINAAGASNVTVTWDSSNLAFTLTDAGATAITVTSPSSSKYIDAVARLFGGATSIQDGTWVGGFPEDCTVEFDLPSDLMKTEYVEWDNRPLVSAPGWPSVSPESSGTPVFYYIRGTKLRIWPVPTEQKLLQIWYKKYPAQITSFDTNISEIPDAYMKGMAYWVAAEMAQENWDQEEHDRLFRKYLLYRNRYVSKYANEHKDTELRQTADRVNYRVVDDT